jgi:hypothetical protein
MNLVLIHGHWSVTPAMTKKIIVEKDVPNPDADNWSIPYLSLLLEQRQEAHYSGMEDLKKSLSERIDSLCID